MDALVFSFHKFVQFAIEETGKFTTLVPQQLPKLCKPVRAMGCQTKVQAFSFCAPKIRLLRGLVIDGGKAMQVLDFAAFPEPEFDYPIFCANFFAASSMNIVVLDLNPLYGGNSQKDYIDKYYKILMPLGEKYAELLPWGGNITSESLSFFSPVVIWTKFYTDQDMHDILFAAFIDYFKAWLKMMDQAIPASDCSQMRSNFEAQHRYLTWRAEKDPGYPLLKKIFGETCAEDLLKNFLFDGVDSLGSKRFLDYFPAYKCKDGAINKQRSMVGKSFAMRPWDAAGNFIAQ